MRTLTFEQITDDRFDNNIKELLGKRIYEIYKQFEGIDGIAIKNSPIKDINFGDNNQCRSTFYIQKYTSKLTWDDVYRKINEIKPAPYSFIERNEIGLPHKKDKDFWSIADCMREEGHTELDIIDISQEDFKTTVFLDNETFEQDAVIDWLRENINIEDWSENGEAICDVTGFVKENYDLLQNFTKEHQILARAMIYDDFDYNVEFGVDCIKELFNGEFDYNAYEYLIDALDLETSPEIETPSYDEEER